VLVPLRLMPRLIKALVFVSCLVPAALLARGLYTGNLGINPAETLQLETGIWALRFLLASLAITPLRRLFGWNRLVQYRRMLGLYAFFYATLHLATYLVLDRYFDWAGVVEDVAKRPFITLGMLAFALMVPLALTSTKGWIRRLGRRWQTLHRLVYLAGIAASLHFIWKVKVAIGEPVYYAAILAALLAIRVVVSWRKRNPPALAKAPAGPP
jgi:methionine sulfoxide reductase heme-binding subunit